jgi:hypothetical protein
MALGHEGAGQTQELARKILVNESDLHRLPPQASCDLQVRKGLRVFLSGCIFPTVTT